MEVKKKKSVVEKTIQQKWKDLLEFRGVKQSWLAAQTEISPEHISNILAGRVFLTEDNRVKINNALGTDY